jgi:hypothetical protein
MVHRKTLDAFLAIVVAWAVLFTVPFFIPQIAWPLNLQIGIVVTAALAIFSVFYFYPSGEETGSSLRLVLGGEELLKELERVEAWCMHFRDIADSIRDIAPMIMALDHLWLVLTELKGAYRGVWTLTRQNEVTMVADQLREASSTLGRKDLEHTKAHVDGARQNAKSLIRELKSESPPSS